MTRTLAVRYTRRNVQWLILFYLWARDFDWKFSGTDVGRTRDLRFTRATPYHLATAPCRHSEKNIDVAMSILCTNLRWSRLRTQCSRALIAKYDRSFYHIFREKMTRTNLKTENYTFSNFENLRHRRGSNTRSSLYESDALPLGHCAWCMRKKQLWRRWANFCLVSTFFFLRFSIYVVYK